MLGGHDTRNFKNFGPRVGFAWDPLKQGKTVVRGGFGIYYDRVVLEVPVLEVLLDGRILPLAASSGSTCHNSVTPATPQDCSLPQSLFDTGTPTLLNPLSGSASTFGIGINVIDNHARQPLVEQFNFGIEQQLGANWTLTADGIHNFGYRLLVGRLLRSTTSTRPEITCTNGIDPCSVVDPLNPQLGGQQITNIESSAKSWYDGLLVSLKKRPTGSGDWRWGFNVNYTLSKTFNFANDDQIPFNGAEDQVNLIEHVNNFRLEKGYAPTDERHRFVFYGIFQMPWKLSVSPIWTWSSSVPIDLFIPSLGSRLPILPRNALAREIQNGAQLNAAITTWNNLPACGGGPTFPFPCNPGGTVPTVNPNTHFGSDFNSLDLRLTKSFQIGERHQFQFIAEVFNLFNITNIRGTNNTNYSGFSNALIPDKNNPSVADSSFNQPIATAGKFFGSGGPRAFQFALRYAF